jgi:hypothetical protein
MYILQQHQEFSTTAHVGLYGFCCRQDLYCYQLIPAGLKKYRSLIYTENPIFNDCTKNRVTT